MGQIARRRHTARTARGGRATSRTTLLSKLPLVSIVDDDDAVRSATTRLVRLHGFSARAFASAEEFLHSAALDETACLITDLQMPGMSGTELRDRLLAQGRRIPVIFITAFPPEGCRAKALEAGAAGFLTKPFAGESLIACLRKAVAAG